MDSTLLRYTAEDISNLDKPFRRNLINGLSGFKSLCLCGTVSPGGTYNLAPMSSVIHVGAKPPLMGMLFRPHVVPRHTLANIESNGVFTLNHVTEETYREAHQASARYPREVSEFEAVGLHALQSDIHPAPYVADAPLKIGLRFVERHQILANATMLIVGEVIELFVPENAVGEDGFLDLRETGTITVSGLDGYYRTELIERLPYARPDESPED